MTKHLLTFLGSSLIFLSAAASTAGEIHTDRLTQRNLTCTSAKKLSATTKAIDISKVPIMETPTYNPEGSDENWITNVTENTFWGNEDVDGYKMAIRRSADGKTIYFRDLTPGFNGDANTEYSWVAGTVDGNDITVKCGQVLYKTDTQVLYLEAVTMDDYGSVESFLPELHFTIEGDKIVQADNSVYLSVYEHAESIDEAGFFIFMNNFEIQPFGDVVSFCPPTDAEVQKWILTSDAGSGFVDVAFSNDTVYVAGLAPDAPDDFVPGTLKDGKLSFKSGYILSSHPLRYIRLIGTSVDGYDEWGYPELSMTMTYDFEATDNNKAFTMTPPENYIVEASYFNLNMINGINNARFFYYAGDVPATPATPSVSDWNETDGVLRFIVPCTDVDGNFINPEHLTYRIELDGTPHTLSPDEYYMVPEEMTEIPYNFTDSYDVYSNGDAKTIFLHAPSFDDVKIISTYTVDGDARQSAAGGLAAITDVTDNGSDIIETVYIDMLGRRVAAPAAGQIMIKKTVRSDGSISVSKEIAR